MNIRVEYTGQLPAVLGRAQEAVLLPDGATLIALLEHLSAHGPASLRSHLRSDDGHWRASLLIAVNGRAHSARLAETVSLTDGDLVTLLPPIGGG